MDNHTEVLKAAIKQWGRFPQIVKAMEELGELQTAIAKSAFGGSSESIIDEIADVAIMVAQLRLIYGAGEVDERIEFKIKRLRERLGIPG